jgi:hypothetical protein
MEWNEIKDENDVNIFLDMFGGFHDSCIKELYLWTGHYVDENFGMVTSGELDTNVRILFQRQYNNPSAIEVIFEGVTQFHISPSPENYESIIYDATLILHSALFYWADDYCASVSEIKKSKTNWISAKKLKWRDVSSWMGQKRRYCVLDELNFT